MPRQGPPLYALSAGQTGSSQLVSISLNGAMKTLFDTGARFDGGLSAHPVSKLYYAIATDTGGFSWLYTIALSGTVKKRFGLGTGFHGGLAYRYADGGFYAVSTDASGFSTLNKLNLTGSTQPMFGLGMRFDGGLTYDPSKDAFYAAASDAQGNSTLYRISMNGATKKLFDLGGKFRGGLAWHPGEGQLYAISTGDQDFGMLTLINLNGAIRPMFGVGLGFAGAGLALSPRLPGQKIWIRAPLADERFLTTQKVRFEAAVTLTSTNAGYEFPDGASLLWKSDKDGVIGHGASFPKSGLSIGAHKVTVTGYGIKTSFSIRVLSDLWALYQSAPASGEMDRLYGDFDIVWLDGATPDQQWTTYDPPSYDQTYYHPTKIAALAKLDILRRQRFSKPVPFTAGKSIYEHVRTYTKRMRFTLGSALNEAGGGWITFDRAVSKWDCSLDDQPGHELARYILTTQLIVHENRHNETGDPFHTSCPSWFNPSGGVQTGMDAGLEPGSGFSRAVMYLMWVYKYAIDDPPEIREAAKNDVTGMLRACFCAKPTHSNPDVQAIIDELLGP